MSPVKVVFIPLSISGEVKDMTLETCKICGTLDKRGAHDDCQGLPSWWLECEYCKVFDDLPDHHCIGKLDALAGKVTT